PGAVARGRAGGGTTPEAYRGRVWGMFRLGGEAEPRQLQGRVGGGEYIRGGDGRLECIRPAPVRIENVEFQREDDDFHPRFCEGMKCGMAAVQKGSEKTARNKQS